MAELLHLIHVTEDPQPWRWEAVKEQIPNLEVKTASVQEFLASGARNSSPEVSSAIVVDVEASTNLLSKFSHVTEAVKRLSVFDACLPKGDHLWTEVIAPAVFQNFFLSQVPGFRLDEDVLIVGLGGLARLCMAGLARLGVVSVRITGGDENLGHKLVADLQKKYFSMKIEYVSHTKVSGLVGVHGLLMNTEPLTIEKEWLDELYFFNFLRDKGVVVDLNMRPRKTPLVLEAEACGGRAISGEVFQSRWDAAFMSQAFGLTIDAPRLAKSLADKADQSPFDCQAIIDRFRSRGQ